MNRTIVVSLFCTSLLAVLVVLSGAEPRLKRPTNELALTLTAADPVKCELLTATGRIMAPRSDTVVPSGLVGLLKGETVVRIYPWCTFRMVDDRPTWNWSFWENSGVRGEPDETKDRLVKRMVEMGFKSFASSDKHYQLAFERNATGYQETVLISDPEPWVGSRESNVGIRLNWTVSSAAKGAIPTYAEIVKVMPTLQPPTPTEGMHRIPEEVLSALTEEPVVEVSLSGPGTTWYSLDILFPNRADGVTPAIIPRIEAALRKNDFIPSTHPAEKANPLYLSLVRSGGKGTSNCQVRVRQREDGFFISMHVQTGVAP